MGTFLNLPPSMLIFPVSRDTTGEITYFSEEWGANIFLLEFCTENNKLMFFVLILQLFTPVLGTTLPHNIIS